MESKHTKGKWAIRDLEIIGPIGTNKHICEMTGNFMEEDEAKANAAYIVKCVNAHEELKNCLQAFVYQIETYNLKHEFPGAYMDAKNALQKINEKE